ncbi:hypothetical protein MMC25_004861 [Agyrium rufum]|nr:hypothetical protein [Agyrium rufum]
MSVKRTIPPLNIKTRSSNGNSSKNGISTATATFQYNELRSTTHSRQQSSTSGSVLRRLSTKQNNHQTQSSSRQQPSANAQMMDTYPGSTMSPPGMFVRALYDYDSDDKTSLSFRQGDIIRVITQLESGWWDGVIDNIRGWFPSNYCAVVTGPNDGRDSHGRMSNGDAAADSMTEDEWEEDVDPRSQQVESSSQPRNTRSGEVQDQAAFWVPQATMNGELYYYNTITGEKSLELPLETPTSVNETGPLDRMNVRVPDQTRVPPEMMVGGYEHDEDDSASEAESLISASRGSLPRRRRSYISDGVSPAASMESLNQSPKVRSRNESRDWHNERKDSIKPLDAQVTSFTGNYTPFASTKLPVSFYDDGRTPTITWNRLVENMKKAVEAYRQAIDNADRSDYVRRVEDISDHLRMLLVAGSGTTDNHSGSPSIISTNKALYPHFRDMMSRFSKLVLSSHIAAADFSTPDSYSKCLLEVQGVLRSVHSYVEVAKSQRGEEIPRLIPGFAQGVKHGGSWQYNNIDAAESRTTSAADYDDHDGALEPSVKLDSTLLDRIDDLKRILVSSLRRLDEQLAVTEKLITPIRHEQISNAICSAAGKVIEFFRPYISIMESIDLSSISSSVPPTQLTEFGVQKQRLYDLIADVVVACQTVAAPLSDEWAERRGESLEARIHEVRSVTKALETAISQIGFTLQALLEASSPESLLAKVKNAQMRENHRLTDGGAALQSSRFRGDTLQGGRPQLGVIGQSHSYSGIDPPKEVYRGENSKVKKFFGEVPGPINEEIPWFLKLDHEGEMTFDLKTNPPQLRGGTLTALVEQLTRHDRLDAPFNNTFLLTYRSFTTAPVLFEMLVERFSIQPPQGISPSDFQVWTDKKQKPIRFRVVNIMKTWLDTYWMENNDAASDQLLRRIHTFAKETVATTNTLGSAPLLSIIEQRLRGQESNTKRLVLTLNTSTPAPILPKNMKKLKFLDIDATEFARQLTIIESKLYGKIKPTECLDKTWQKKLASGEPEPAPNVKALILHSNQMTNWVAEMILAQADVRRRVIVIKHFITVADKCRTLNNFSTLTSIVSAFAASPIHRLSRTWTSVSARTLAMLESLRQLMDRNKNFASYRATLRTLQPPCIPFFGVYLTDLTFIEEGIPSVMKRTNLINFTKRTKTAEVIRDIQQYQNAPYPLQAVPELQDHILSQLQGASDVHEMYDKSLQVEPREREDEKIARYDRGAVRSPGAPSTQDIFASQFMMHSVARH